MKLKCGSKAEREVEGIKQKIFFTLHLKGGEKKRHNDFSQRSLNNYKTTGTKHKILHAEHS